MKLLNLGCGDQRPQGFDWINLDDLHAQFPLGTPERLQMDYEPSYCNHKVVPGAALPFADNELDGVLASHFFEHWDAQDGLKIMQDCYRILKPGGVLLVSVPDASYFRRVYPEDRNENWPRLFDVTDPKNPIPTWFEAALWFSEHRSILTEDALWAYLVRAGFGTVGHVINQTRQMPEWFPRSEPFNVMFPLLNRRIFSLEMAGVKPV